MDRYWAVRDKDNGDWVKEHTYSCIPALYASQRHAATALGVPSETAIPVHLIPADGSVVPVPADALERVRAAAGHGSKQHWRVNRAKLVAAVDALLAHAP